MYHANVNINLMVENAIQTKGEIMINVVASVKTPYICICEKDYIWNPARCSCNDGKFISNYYQRFSDYL